MSHEKWPALMGKLHADFTGGRDRMDWGQYLAKSVPPQVGSAGEEMERRPRG